MSCVELSRKIGEFLKRGLFEGYVFQIENEKLKLLISDASIKRQLGISDQSLVFHCNPRKFYLSTLPIFFNETIRDIVDIISKLSVFLTIHPVGILTVIYEKYDHRNVSIIKIMENLDKNLLARGLPTIDKIELAILIHDLLEASNEIKRIRREYKDEDDYNRYQLEWEKLNRLLKRIGDKLGSDELERVIPRDVGRVGDRDIAIGEVVVRKMISESVGSESWARKAVFVTPSEILGSVDENAISIMNSLPMKLLNQGIEIFFYIPSRFSFIANFISNRDRAVIV
ncbi:MAG: hypothetical protein QXU53_05175 [Thermosphaera sp.]